MLNNIIKDAEYIDNYYYDENGNMTCRIEGSGEERTVYWHSYNNENRLSKVEEIDDNCDQSGKTGTVTQSWTFTYDGDGTRIKEEYYDGEDTITKLFLFGGSYEVEKIYKSATQKTTTETTKYYALGGQRVMREDNGDLHFFLTDHLGSTVAVLDSSGNIESEQRYMPFGGTRYSQGVEDETDFGYTGQRNYKSFGLMDYNARFYSPKLGRFTQPDTIVPGMSSQSFNRYSYVNNNPVMMVDPSGHMLCNAKYDYCVEPNGESSGSGNSYPNFDVCGASAEMLECLTANGLEVPSDLVDQLPTEIRDDEILYLAWLLLYNSIGREWALYAIERDDMNYDTTSGTNNAWVKYFWTETIYFDKNLIEKAEYSLESLSWVAGLMAGELFHASSPYEGEKSKFEEFQQNWLTEVVQGSICNYCGTSDTIYINYDPYDSARLEAWEAEVAQGYYEHLPNYPEKYRVVNPLYAPINGTGFTYNWSTVFKPNN